MFDATKPQTNALRCQTVKMLALRGPNKSRELIKKYGMSRAAPTTEIAQGSHTEVLAAAVLALPWADEKLPWDLSFREVGPPPRQLTETDTLDGLHRAVVLVTPKY